MPNGSVDEPTMAAVWEYLTPDKREELARILEVSVPILALTKLSTAMAKLIDNRIYNDCEFAGPITVEGGNNIFTCCEIEQGLYINGENNTIHSCTINNAGGNAVNFGPSVQKVKFQGTTGVTTGISVPSNLTLTHSTHESHMSDLLHPTTLAFFIIALAIAGFVFLKGVIVF